jgi:predicted ester cyclase
LRICAIINRQLAEVHEKADGPTGKLSSAFRKEELTMQDQVNKAHCRRFIQQIFNEGKLDRIREFIAADAWNHELGDEPAPTGRSPEYFADLIRLYREAFPDFHVEILDQVAENGRVVTSMRFRGTQKNPLLGIPSHGRSMKVDGIRIDYFVGDTIVESWFQWDSVGMLRQLGVLPNLWEREATAKASGPAVVWYIPPPEEQADLGRGSVKEGRAGRPASSVPDLTADPPRAKSRTGAGSLLR